MSEFMNVQSSGRGFRWHLLTSVSALALLTAVNVRDAKATDEDADRPTVWIELGGEMDHVGGQGQPFAPGFLAANSGSSVLEQSATPLQAQRPPAFSFGEEGKISFQPEGSDWLFSASALYGRSGSLEHVHHQTYGFFYIEYKYGAPIPGENKRGIDNFADTHAQRGESHTVLDFQVGKDVGLGMFGRDASSTLSLGVRFAQFASQATFDIRARPDLQFYNKSFPTFHLNLHLPYFHTYHATGQSSRSFHGIGPSLSWNGSAPVVGNPRNGEVTFDWGANAALLFGRQKTRAQHQESAHYVTKRWAFAGGGYYTAYQHPPTGHSIARFVTVPNVGGFAGATWRIQNFKVSLGYRADFFFGAIDGGIDARKSETLGFYGPFASVSVGIGG